MRGRSWSVPEKERLFELRARGLSMAEIARALSRPPGSCRWIASRIGLHEKKPIFFCFFLNSQRFYFKLPLRRGIEKLIRRVETVLEWVQEEGRDDYEIARALHVPIPDVAYFVARLGLRRPYDPAEDTEPDLVTRRCLSCRQTKELSRYVFRCEACLDEAGGTEPEFIFEGIHEYPSI